MGLFDFLGDPAKKWVREAGLRLEVDLKRATLCGVALGSRPASLSRLGPPTNPKPTKTGQYVWKDLGLDANGKDGILGAYTITLKPAEPDPDQGLYPGTFLLDGTPLPLSAATRREDVVRLLGEPWHEYRDDEDPEISLTIFYETRTLEWAFEFVPAGTLAAIVLASPPDLAGEKTRAWLKCTKPWPP
jgi:hypothetical protein